MQLPPESFFEGTPLHVRAYIEQLHAIIADLHTRMAELESKHAKNSTNSSLPPSSEHPHAKPARHTTKSPRRSGGQPGHAKHQLPLLPNEQCQQVIPCVPPTCRRCAALLSGTDPQPLRHQVWELPEIKPSVIEYQRHRLTCRCGTVTCGVLPAGVPTSQAGPRLIAFSGLLLSCFRQSKRRAALFLSMILHQPACPGWMVSLQKLAAEAVQPAYDVTERLIRALGDIAHGTVQTGILYRPPADPTPEDEEEIKPLQDAAKQLFGLDNALLEMIADQEAYLQSAHDLVLGKESTARRVAGTPFEAIPYCLSFKCDGCLYNEFCMKWSAEKEDLSLLPYMTGTDKEAMRRADITTV